MSQQNEWQDFAMGPTIREYLGIKEKDYRGEDRAPDAARDQAFGRFFLELTSKNGFDDQEQFLTILEELVGMKLGREALLLHQSFPDLQADQQFRGLLSLGSAGMLTGDLDRAEEWLIAAQELVPEELAPYLNLAQLYYHTHRDDDARQWALAGLEIDANHRGLWEIVGQICQASEAGHAGQAVRDIAIKLDSWAGISLAALLIDAEDPMLRVQWLERHYSEGLRDEEFLIEYTAALGVALQYERIPPIIWQAETSSKKQDLCWQLYAHGAQAQLAQENHAEALPLLERLLKNYQLNQELATQFQQLAEECREALGTKIQP